MKMKNRIAGMLLLVFALSCLVGCEGPKRLSMEESMEHFNTYEKELQEIAEKYGYQFIKTVNPHELNREEFYEVRYAIRFNVDEGLDVTLYHEENREYAHVFLYHMMDEKPNENTPPESYQYLPFYTELHNCLFPRYRKEIFFRNVIEGEKIEDDRKGKQEIIHKERSGGMDWMVVYSLGGTDRTTEQSNYASRYEEILSYTEWTKNGVTGIVR